MRMHLTAQAPHRLMSSSYAAPVSLTIRPACGLPGNYSYSTDSQTLLSMLKSTDLPSTVLDRFMSDLRSAPNARLWGVELDDRVLTRIGYFVD